MHVVILGFYIKHEGLEHYIRERKKLRQLVVFENLHV